MERVLKGLGLFNFLVMAAGVMAGSGVLIIYAKRLPPQVPLWYSRSWGEEQLASPAMLWVLVALILVTGIGAGIGGRKGVLGAMVLAGGIVIQVMLMLALLRIVMLVV